MYNVVMGQIYRSSLFLFIYNAFKALWGFVTGTSEIYRICDAVVANKGLESVRIPADVDILQLSIAETKKISIDAETLYRLGISHLNIDLCILFSKKLEDFRRPFESWYTQFDISPLEYIEPGSGKKFENLIQLLMKEKRFPKVQNVLTAQSLVLRAAMTKVYGTFQLLNELNVRAATRYDINTATNEKILLEVIVIFYRFGIYWFLKKDWLVVFHYNGKKLDFKERIHQQTLGPWVC
jgi:hypothetical protein